MQFNVSSQHSDKIIQWLEKEVLPPYISKQKETIKNPSAEVQECWEKGAPYGPPEGDGIVFHFSLTKTYTIFKVTYDNHELDLTDCGVNLVTL